MLIAKAHCLLRRLHLFVLPLYFFYRIVRKDRWQYAIAGLFGVAIASGFAYLAGNAKNYFLPGLISGLFFFLLSLGTLIIKKPLAAWVSHLSRGWRIDWFWRNDIKPAYQEVTYFWTAFFLIRLILLTLVYLRANSWMLFLSNIVLGFPTTILVLSLSYIYGIWRLTSLKGPGIDEFIAQTPPPWKGQQKGF